MSTIELPHTSGCLVCGQANPHGLHLRLFVDPASGVVTTDFTPRAEHIGFEGIVHGGIVATVIDEAMVWAATWSGRRFCVCGEMSVRFRQSVEVGKTVRVTARVDSSRARLITTEADVRCGETTHALATGKYVPLPEAHSARFITTLVPEKSTEAAAQFLRGATT